MRSRARGRGHACVYVCVCGCTSAGVWLLTYPVFHAQAQYFLRSLSFHHIFRYYLTIFGTKSLNIKCESRFLYIFYLKHFLFEEEIGDLSSSCTAPINLVRFWLKFNFLHRFSKKAQISSFIKIRPVGAELCHVDKTDGRTDGHDEAISRFSQFCESAW